MRTILLVLLLGSGGCSVAPTNELGELYVEHARCLEAGTMDCENIWEEIERRERVAASRDRQRECPSGTVGVGNAHGPVSCVSPSKARSLLSEMLR